MQKKIHKLTLLLILGIIISNIGLVNGATTWGVCVGDGLKYKATQTHPTLPTRTTTIIINVTAVSDSVTANFTQDTDEPVSTFLNTLSIDPDFGINIKTTNDISVRYIAYEARLETLKSQIDTAFEEFTTHSVTRDGNVITATASGSGWSYVAVINYTSAFVLDKMTETHTSGDGVQTVVWEKLNHIPGPGCKTGDNNSGEDVPGFSVVLIFAAGIIGILFITKRKNVNFKIE